jgi:hypothetical protein
MGSRFVEARLLLKGICSSWFGSFFFQSGMHTFMTAILLGMARFDALDANAQAQPPDCEFA